ncbi:MAG: folate-binding Fe/S cluster repair protein [Moraxella sp.]|uniref:CAF17-like 4Fe-4S cluster assembly/insertion protein YgfZ n=1 Tax=Moraxella sp. TaxID=479 RepID=UPI0026DCDF9E|nr:folate-binding Fe/S cluster repair protein [Moraxella sp.]MDO4449546.1 folate-binding Fe/S cluster repair protein [Moraxella sp.]
MNSFLKITLSGQDAGKFLQGQLTVDVNKLTNRWTPCAISNLKGRVLFGLWVAHQDDGFALITSSDCMEGLVAHFKKYGAFSKFTQSTPAPIHPTTSEGIPTFSEDEAMADFDGWAKTSIQTGNAWITKDTQELFQPQELRLHQRGGVDYDKGCYLGQEIIARLYFKSSPKAYLHRILLTSDTPNNIQIVNSIHTDEGIEALAIGTPDNIACAGQLLPLPESLTGDVARSTLQAKN